jgi:broad specificity phosphatase PhoE
VHNLCTENHVIPDPLLTDLGHEQCRTLRDTFPRHANIDLVTASPLRRTLYTALESFEPVLKAKPDLKVIALPDIQEISDVPCDTGSEPSVLKEEFKSNVDLDLVQEGWNNKVCFFLAYRISPRVNERINTVLTDSSNRNPVPTHQPTKPSSSVPAQPAGG